MGKLLMSGLGGQVNNNTSPAQKKFLDALLSQKALKNFKILRDVNNKTAKFLQKRELVVFVIMVVWIITPTGLETYRRTHE
ncbi:TPA: hypothetical protein ACGHHK_002502 [Salmonella enterica subsp. enterica serovar Victoria]|nr:hypothetical protein [Salmonella enterica]